MFRACPATEIPWMPVPGGAGAGFLYLIFCVRI